MSTCPEGPDTNVPCELELESNPVHVKLIMIGDKKPSQIETKPKADLFSVSVAIPALNEAGNITSAVKATKDALEKHGFSDFEIILIDGGSSDGTPKIMDEIGSQDGRIKVGPHIISRGLGHSVTHGFSCATKQYVGWFPGDNETLPETMKNVFAEIGKVDVIIPYTVNPWVRTPGRRILSAVYLKTFNAVFGTRLKYFNGPCFFRRPVLDTVIMSTDGPAYMMEILVQLVKSGEASYVEVPMYLKARDYGKSSVLKWGNVWEIAKTAAKLFFRIHFCGLPKKGGVDGN
ncbi:MAG: glycosyltransferase family 2 protein [Patescibacteria group bacterium]